jgi:hypothetical protein
MLRELELLAQVPPRAEDERLHSRDGQVELCSYLGVGAALNLSEEDDGALVLGQAADGRGDLTGSRTVHFGHRDDHLGVESDLLRAPGEIPIAPSADIARNRDEPGPGLLRLFAAANRAEGVQESNLGDVLCFVRIAHITQHGSVDIAPVLAIEPLERSIALKPLLKRGAHAPYMPTGDINITSLPCKFWGPRGLFTLSRPGMTVVEPIQLEIKVSRPTDLDEVLEFFERTEYGAEPVDTVTVGLTPPDPFALALARREVEIYLRVLRRVHPHLEVCVLD